MRCLKVYSRSIAIALLVFANLGCDSKTALEHLQSAHEGVANGESRVAIIELKNAIQKDSSLGEARSLLGQLHYQAGDLPSALKELERAIDLDVSDDVTLLTLLRTKNLLGRYSEVVGELETQESLAPGFAVVLANAYIIAGDLERAKPLLQQGLHLADGLLGMAKVASLESDLERAYSYSTQMVEQYPEAREGWLFKGELELSQGDEVAALYSFGQAQGLPGGSVAGSLGIIRAHLLADDLTAAQAEADELVSLTNEFPPAHYLKGLISFKQNDMDAAETSLRIVQRYDSGHLPTLYLMGAVKARQGQFNQAEDNLRRYLVEDPNNVSARKLLASIYFEQNKNEEALKTLTSDTGQHSDPQLWAMLGAAHIRAGSPAEATEALQRAVELAPDMVPFRNQLALGLLLTGQDEEAMAELSVAVDLDEDQFQSDYILVMVKLRDEDYAGAAVAVDQLIAKSTENPIGYNLLGAVALAQNDVAAAKTAFDRALMIDPSYFPAAQNLARLAETEGDFGGAEEFYQNILAANADSEVASLALVDLAVRQGDTETGLTLLADVVARHPQSVRAKLGQLRLLIALEQLEEAERVAQMLFELAPKVPDVLLLKAEVDLRAGDRNAAQQMASKLQRLLDQFKGNKVLLAAAGTLQLRLGNLTIARNNLKLATEGGEVPERALVSFAQLELAEGNARAAQTRIDQLIEQGFTGEQVELLQGDTFVAANKLDQARAHFQAMAEKGSRAGTTRYALTALEQGDFAEAQRSLQEWLEGQPSDRGVKVLLANVQIQAGEQDAAKAQYEAMLPTDDPVVLNNLAWIYMHEGDERSLDMARLANAAAPNNSDIEDTLGWILVDRGAIEEGLDLLRSSARARPDNASVHYHLGIGHLKSGDMEAASRALKRALKIGNFTDSGEAAAAERALAEL